MYRKIEDFIADWSHDAQNTIKVYNNITNDALDKKIDENVRSIARLVWHINISVGEMANRAGLGIYAVPEHAEPPHDIKTIIAEYEKTANSLSENLKKWSDNDLNTEVEMYGEHWKKGVVLQVIIMHQAHHRGQLTVLMRMAGLKVPGVFGPSKEEWVQYGMEPML